MNSEDISGRNITTMSDRDEKKEKGIRRGIRRLTAGFGIKRQSKSEKQKLLLSTRDTPSPDIPHEIREIPAGISTPQTVEIEPQISPSPIVKSREILQPEPTEEALGQQDQQNSTVQLAIESPEQSIKSQPLVASDPDPSNILEKPPEPILPQVVEVQTTGKSPWDEAYESLQEKNSRLVLWYETILSPNLGKSVPDLPPQSTSSDTFANLIDKRDWKSRRGQMKELFDLWLQGEGGSSHNNGISLGDIIKNTVSMTPAEAVPAWVAISYAASEVVLQPTKENIDDCKGLIYIVSRMEWYCHLPRLLDEDAEDDAASADLKKRIISLYAAILSYLMTVVCSRLGNLTFGTPSNSIFQSRRIGLNTVKDTENALPIFNEDRVKEPLEGFLGAISAKPSTSEDVIRQPSPSYSKTPLFDNLKVIDPRLSLPAARDYPGHQLYKNLSSTTKYRWFQNWDVITEPENWLFWVRGEHNQGKTMLLTGAVLSLLSATSQEQSGGCFVSFFFFDRARAKEESNSPAAALKTIIWLILANQPDLATHLSKKADCTDRRSFNDPNDFLALSDIFYNIIEDERFAKTYIVVGSIEDCISGNGWPGVDHFLDLIAQSLKLSNKIKWLISSDESERFQKAFLDNGCQHFKLGWRSLGMNVTILAYITAKVEDLIKTKKYDEELADEVVDGLLLASQGNYLWVDIVYEALRSEETWYATDLLHDVKGTNVLNGSLYDCMFGIFDKFPRRDKEYCTMVLSIMALTHDTLRIDELDALAHLGKRVDLMNILKKCSAFLVTDENRVSFRHQSAKAYVRERVLSPSQLPRLHSELAKNCIEFVGETLRKNKRTVKSQLADGNNATQDDASCYSTLNWITHLSEIQDIENDPDVYKKVCWFFSNHFLEWVQDLVLQEQLPMAATKLQNLDFSLQLRISQDRTIELLGAIIQDAYLFIRLHQSLNTPKDVSVHNTLLFSPTESIIKRVWVKKAFPWLLSPPAMDRQWGRNIRTFDGHTDRVRSVAFSSDGKLIASGSDDSSVRIWDAETGTTQHKFKRHGGWIDSVAISSRGIVAVGCDDGPIIMWSLSTGREVRRLPTEPETVSRVCFSNDGSKLAVYSSCTVRIWDLDSEVSESGTLKSCYIEHSNDVGCIAFGKDDRLLATGACDSKIRVWDLEQGEIAVTWLKTHDDLGTNGEPKEHDKLEATSEATEPRLVTEITHLREPLRTLDCHTGAMNSVAFSPDSKIIASGSDDGIVWIWELDAGEPGKEVCKPLEANRGAVHSIAFSPDANRYILASCTERAIDIWDAKIGEHLMVMRSPSTTLHDIAFSPTGGYFATGASDFGVHLWYFAKTSKEAEQTSIFKPGRINDLSLSPNDRVLAIAHEGGHLILWDTETNNELCNPRMDSGHTESVVSVSFSPMKGSMLLSSSTDHSISICDVKTGKRLHRFLSHADWIRFSVWSPDENYIASGSEDGAVRIWKIGDMDDQKPQILRHGNEDYPLSVSFSHDSQLIATCGNDRKVLIWKRTQNKNGWYIHRKLEGQALSVLISPGSTKLLVGSSSMIRIHDLNTYQKSNTITTKHKIKKMWFDKHWLSHVMTEYGAIPLNSSSTEPSQAPSWCPYWRSIDPLKDEEWIMWYDRKVIFIPKEFRPSVCGVFGHMVVVCTNNGHIHVYRFSKTMNPGITA
ncbi:WD40 repeat-like protein [Annulohypoxylon maeteangense]|uniref:WD40 repeat-like protein n=1 Tax=Annulohypoxylon maeteangense TaxID=1927788 RepID=UPI00200796C8|nr:WD40 repeat-like protein [Annulohypoxylon maeteangense]KAI0883900.1 WD40 repeat-like protein [Annulohypoxylon maeteangense]